MAPTLHPGDWLWVRSHSSDSLNRGDIVLAQFPAGLAVKRIVGLPGETIETRSGRVYVNGQPHPESYILESAYLEPKADISHRLAPEQYVLLGDARDDSLDSRMLGPITRSHVEGVVTHILWPFRRIARLPQAG